jgi:hypothetical protein
MCDRTDAREVPTVIDALQTGNDLLAVPRYAIVPDVALLRVLCPGVLLDEFQSDNVPIDRSE